jgi:hypothetical protein
MQLTESSREMTQSQKRGQGSRVDRAMGKGQLPFGMQTCSVAAGLWFCQRKCRWGNESADGPTKVQIYECSATQ